VALNPSGKFAYVANLGSNNVSAFAINANTGALTAVGLPVDTITGPISVTVDLSGSFAYVASDISDTISTFAINATTGALTAVGAPVAAGSGPTSVATTGKIQ